MIKRYDATQQSWIDAATTKRYDTTQRAWVDVNSVKRYDTTEQAWVEMAYKYLRLESYSAPNEDVCYDVDGGLGVRVALKSYSSGQGNGYFYFMIDDIDFPAGTKVKFDLESGSNAIMATVEMYSETVPPTTFFNYSYNSSDRPNVEITSSYRLKRVTIMLKPGTRQVGMDIWCSGYLRNIEIGGMKFKFPDISINE